jgi:hypothetical protein
LSYEENTVFVVLKIMKLFYMQTKALTHTPVHKEIPLHTFWVANRTSNNKSYQGSRETETLQHFWSECILIKGL